MQLKSCLFAAASALALTVSPARALQQSQLVPVIPAPQTTQRGGVFAGSAAAHQFLTAISTSGLPIFSTLQAADVVAALGFSPVAPSNYPIYAAAYGENCNGSFDNFAAYTKAAAAAVAQGRSLEFGAGSCVVATGPIVVNGPLYEMHGKGLSVTNIQERFNGPLFQMNVTGAVGLQNFRYHDMTMSAYFKPVPASYPSLTTAFYVTGDNLGLFQHGSFDDLHLQGFFAGITLAKPLPASSDRFGYEGTADWLSFNRITCQASTQDGQWCIWFKQGSGTGNTFSDMRTAITGAGTGSRTPSAAIRYDGPASAVVGDQVVTGGHFGGVHSVFSVAPGTKYRSNMSVTGSQLDAGVSNYADLPADGPVFTRLLFTGDNVGGGVQLALPPVAGSIIDDQLVDQRRAGTNGATLPSSPSPASTNLFLLKTGSTTNPDFYGGTKCEVQVDGLIRGVAGGITAATYELPYAPSGFRTPVPVSSTQSTPNSSFFTITTAIANGAVTFAATYTAANGGFINDAQIVCRGGTYTLKRLL